MVLDSEQQRQFLMAAVEATNWPGKLAEEIVKLKFVLKQAQVDNQKEMDE